MNKSWTGPELKAVSIAYSTIGMNAAIKASCGRSGDVIKRKMCDISNKCATSNASFLKAVERKWYAEDIAIMFELQANGTKASLIAEYMNTTKSSIYSAMQSAARFGFEKYPLRNES